MPLEPKRSDLLVSQILDEINKGRRKADIAELYSYVIERCLTREVAAVDQAIINHWSKTEWEDIKQMAWQRFRLRLLRDSKNWP